MKNFTKTFALAISSIALFTACESNMVESVTPVQRQDKNFSINKPGNTRLMNTTLSYGSSITYMGAAATISPTSVPSGSGTFSAKPEGLYIDPVTGVIDRTASETGMWFTVSYTTSTQVYTTDIMISGIEYASAIYNSSQVNTVIPYYNASTSNTMPSGSFSVLDNSGLSVNASTGVINIANTKASIPLNGYIETVIGYQLNDASQGTMNKIKVRVYKYASVDDIPASVLEHLSGYGGARMETDTTPKSRTPYIVIIAG